MRSPTSAPGPTTRLKTPSRPWRSITRLQMFCTAIGGQRRLRRRLPDHGVAAHRGERRVPRPHRDREVEGGDDADHAERVPLLVHAVAGPLRLHGQAVELARQADREVAHVDHLLDLAEALGEDLAHLERDQPAERLLVLAQLVAELAHDLAALRRRHHAPGRERRRGGRDHRLVGFGVGLDHGRDRLAGRGVDRGQLPPTGGADPLSVRRTQVGGLDAQLREDLRDVAHGPCLQTAGIVPPCTRLLRA